MRFILFFVILVAILADDREVRVDALFKDYSYTPGVHVSIIQNGNFVYKKGFGYQEYRNKIPINEKTNFLIGSVSKQFTALAIALLEEKGLLKDTDPIQKYIPELKVLGNTTLVQLIQHVSGYKDYLNLFILTGRGLPYFDITKEEAFELIKRQTSLGFRPNTKWDYSNTGYLLLEIVVERVSGLDFKIFMKRNIFDPLGMSNVQLENDRTVVIENSAYGYTKEVTGAIRYAPLISQGIMGAGGIQMNAIDFLKYDQNFYNNKLPGGQALIKKLMTPGTLIDGRSHGYGYGLFVEKQQGLTIIHHSGGFPGYLTQMTRILEKNITVCMTSNIADGDVIKKANDAILIYLGAKDLNLKNIHEIEELKIQKVNQKVKNPLQYIGYYHSSELQTTYHLQNDSNGLFIILGRLGRIPIILKDKLNFWFGQQGGTSGRFVQSNEDIVGMEIIDFSRAPNIVIRKVERNPVC